MKTRMKRNRKKELNKKEIQKELKKMILVHAKELQKGKYTIADVSVERNIPNGWSIHGFVEGKDSGRRLLSILYNEKLKMKKEIKKNKCQ